MEQASKLKSKKSGLPPGSLVHVGNKKKDKTKITVIDYDAKDFEEKEFQKIEDCFGYHETESVSWINIDGLSDIEVIETLGNKYKIHSLLLEDILNTQHRPKVEEFENCVFLTLKMLGIHKDLVISEQVSFVLGKNWIISFQEQEGDIFDGLRKRLRENKTTIRSQSADYLFYRLVDTVVDNYFFVTEYFSDKTEKLEEKVLKNPDTDTLYEIQLLKRELAKFKKSVTPLREAISFLEKDSTELIKKSTIPYFKDVYEHIIQLNETIDTQRDFMASIMDLQMSGVSNKMNEVMKVLTIIATIFIPLTFVAGIYGMNFKNMPELNWKYGYFVVWGLMIAIFIGMMVYFKRKKWL